MEATYTRSGDPIVPPFATAKGALRDSRTLAVSGASQQGFSGPKIHVSEGSPLFGGASSVTDFSEGGGRQNGGIETRGPEPCSSLASLRGDGYGSETPTALRRPSSGFTKENSQRLGVGGPPTLGHPRTQPFTAVAHVPQPIRPRMSPRPQLRVAVPSPAPQAHVAGTGGGDPEGGVPVPATNPGTPVDEQAPALAPGRGALAVDPLSSVHTMFPVMLSPILEDEVVEIWGRGNRVSDLPRSSSGSSGLFSRDRRPSLHGVPRPWNAIVNE